MQIRQLMNQPPVTCRPTDSLNLAAGLMWDHDCGALPVVDDAERVVGVITDRDICMAAYTQGSPIHAVPVANVMSKDVYTIGPSDSIENAETIMRARQVRRLPVVDGEGHALGMLTLSDLVQESTREVGRRKREITDAEVATTLAAVCAPRRPVSLVQA